MYFYQNINIRDLFVPIVICVYGRPDDDEQGWNSSQEVILTACDLNKVYIQHRPYNTKSLWYAQYQNIKLKYNIICICNY